LEFLAGFLAVFFMRSKSFLWLVLLFSTLIFLARPEGFVCVILLLAWPHLPKERNLLHYAYLTVMISILAMIVMNKAFR
jgi:uncharacterized membrane protein